MNLPKKAWIVVPCAVSAALVLTACGGSSGGSPQSVAQQPAAAPAAPVAAPAAAAAGTDTSANPGAATGKVSTPTTNSAPAGSGSVTSKASGSAAAAPAAAVKVNAPAGAAKSVAPGAAKSVGGSVAGITSIDNPAQAAENAKMAAAKAGATDTGVTKDLIKVGSVSMHGMALGNVLITPMVAGLNGSLQSINDRGGVLGRRMALVDCDDGPGEVSRSKACIKKLVGEDKIFSLLTYSTWASASIHDDLKQFHIPAVGTWAYSQTEWQDPYMFPTHMSMIHEAMAGAHWAANVIKPKTYGLVCLTSPEMQLACNQVQKILDVTGAKMVKRADVSISETSMSSYVLAFRAAGPEHIIHYVINPATMAKFMVEAAQQGYYPPKGISGNHLAAEVLGSIFGKWPAGRYWTNTTYKLWGPEFMATMNKYARFNKGTNHHIVQAGYVGANVFARAARAIGPNLTRDRLMAQLGNGDVYASDTSLDQRFSWRQSERTGENWDHSWGQGREFMYRYESANTVSNPDGTPNGFTPDGAGGPAYEGNGQFVLYTWK